MHKIIEAPAKINIGLDVFKLKHGESKHKIKSIFVLDNEYVDQIEITNASKLTVNYFMNKKNNVFKNDIVTKTMLFLKNNFNIKINYKIIIEKNIPIQAGLGGSSADAGAIIKFFIQKEKLKINKKTMLKIALELGSDIPFFIIGYEMALVSKYGNIIKQINKPLPKYEIIPVQVQSYTKKIYETLDNNWIKQEKNKFKKIIRSMPNLTECKITNHLEKSALELNPSLLDYVNKSLLMTGSGSYFIKFKGE